LTLFQASSIPHAFRYGVLRFMEARPAENAQAF
jgi:hypothetical protein